MVATDPRVVLLARLYERLAAHSPSVPNGDLPGLREAIRLVEAEIGERALPLST